MSELWHKLRPNIETNLRSGFRATGLHPRNRNEPLKYLPDENGSDAATVGRHLDSVLINMLKINRGIGQTRQGRGSKIVPGKMLTLNDVESSAEAGPSGWSRGRGRSQGGAKARVEDDSSASSSSSDEEDVCARCSAPYSTYRGLDWIQCVTCAQWICGKCNGGSDDPFYECPRCEQSLK